MARPVTGSPSGRSPACAASPRRPSPGSSTSGRTCRPETRRRWRRRSPRPGFQPSAVARSLVQRRSQTLGVVVAGLRYFGVAQTLNGITEEAQAAGYGVLLKEIESTETVDIGPVIEFMIAHRVEAIIFAAPAARDQHRAGPLAAAGRVAADHLPQVRAVAIPSRRS